MNRNNRWSTGTGEIKWGPRRSGGRIGIDFYEPANGFGSALRAMVWIHSKKDFEVILFQGLGHKDTKAHYPRWQNVESIVLRHLTDIDRDLGRPGNKFKFPTLRDATAPIVGDVVVIGPGHPSHLYSGSHEGVLGVVKGVIPGLYCKVATAESLWTPCDACNLEVIDHDEDLLKDPEDVPSEKARNYVLGKMMSDGTSQIDATKQDIRRAEFIAWMKANYGTEDLWRNPANLPPSDFIWQGWNAARLSDKTSQIDSGSPQVFEEDGWEYWLEMSTDNGLYLWKKCKTCESVHSRIARQIL